MSPQDRQPAILAESTNWIYNARSNVAAWARPTRRRLAAAIAIALAITGSGLIVTVPVSATTANLGTVGILAQTAKQNLAPIQVRLPNAQVGYQYSYQNPNDANGNLIYMRNPPPAGLSETTGGLITGVPTQPGDFSFSTYGWGASGKVQTYINSMHVNWPVFNRSAPTSLSSGEFLQFANKKFIMQTDGNLVMYDERGRALFASNTDWGPGLVAGYHVTFQADCNVVIYSISGAAVWASNTARPTNSCSGGVVTVVDRLRFFDGSNVRTVAWDSTMGGMSIPPVDPGF